MFVDKFRFWAQKVLPTEYDDSLSYYEVLNKMGVKLNQVIDAVNENTEDVAEAVADVNQAVNTVDTFAQTLQEAADDMEQASSNATLALSTAENAEEIASRIESTATQALSTAQRAMQNIEYLRDKNNLPSQHIPFRESEEGELQINDPLGWKYGRILFYSVSFTGVGAPVDNNRIYFLDDGVYEYGMPLTDPVLYKIGANNVYEFVTIGVYHSKTDSRNSNITFNNVNTEVGATYVVRGACILKDGENAPE